MSGFSQNDGVTDGPRAEPPFRFRRVARRRFPVRTVVTLAAILLLAGTAAVVMPDLLRHRGDDRAVALLDRIVPADEPIPAGTYRVVTQRGWYLHSSDDGQQLVESETSVWEPADPAGEWIRRSHQTGAARALTPGIAAPAPTAVDTITGRCGVFFVEDGCATPGSWSSPTPDFLAGLPRDPDELLAALRRANKPSGMSDGAVIGIVADLMVGSPVPADLRIALCRSLLLIEGNDVADGATDLLGRSAIVVSGPHPNGHREEILLDPDDGSLLGRRQTAMVDTWVPVGTVVADVAVTVDITDRATELAGG